MLTALAILPLRIILKHILLSVDFGMLLKKKKKTRQPCIHQMWSELRHRKMGNYFLWQYLFLTFWYLKANVQHAFFFQKFMIKSVNGETEDCSSHVWVSTCFIFFFVIALALLALLCTFCSLFVDHLFLCTLVLSLSKFYF